MRVRIAAGAVVALALAGAALGTSLAQERDPADDGRLELRMAYREAKVTFVDNPPRMTKRRQSESPGDMAVSRGALRDAAGRRIGTVHSVFTISGGASPRTSELSTAVFLLRDGQIATQGVVLNQPGGRGPDRDVLPVVGGSGAYAGARGTMTVTTGKRGVAFAFDLRR